jgi:hypothetical protein
MGYMKKGGSIKAPCKLGRNKPTKLLWLKKKLLKR